ncbi:MAG: hypothetical protein ISS69_06215 [Phycisphaerae bacterium]|nr:hypothetical protein [Phycisphaerae bacterium]
MTIEDPDELDKVDHDIRVNELRAKAQELTGDKIEAFENPDAPPEVIEQFWENVVAFEKAEWTTDREELEADGVYLLPPDEVKDELLPELLLKLCQHLAEGGTFVFHTEHLSDRELYEYFWREGLNEPRKKMRSPEEGGEFMGGFFLDLVGSGSEEDTILWLKYYATDQQRAEEREYYPDSIPTREAPPYPRDHLLPHPPDGPDGMKWY